MSAENVRRLRDRRDFDGRGSAAGARKLQPEGAVVGLASAGSAEVNAQAFDVALQFLAAGEGPRLGVGHVDKCDGRLILIGARAGAGVFRGREDAAGDDEIVGARGAEATEVAGAAVVFQVIVTGSSGAEC